MKERQSGLGDRLLPLEISIFETVLIVHHVPKAPLAALFGGFGARFKGHEGFLGLKGRKKNVNWRTPIGQWRTPTAFWRNPIAH
jgi:hypothetical protein